MTEPDGENNRAAAATAGGAIGLGALASFVSLCCIGPWSVMLLGVSGAVAVARLAPFRPYILALAAVLVMWTFWRIYRPRSAVGRECRAPIRLRSTVWLSAILLGLAFFADELQWLLVDPTPEALRK